jgi:hypothetical protein
MTYQHDTSGTLHRMRHKLTILALAALTLTGCSSTTEPAPAPDCVTVSDGVATALTNGITHNITLTRFAATPSPNTDGIWYVAAHWDDGDLEGEAVWATTQNPAGEDAAFLSVDEVAETISTYNRLDGGTAAAPGAQAATNCLN